SNGARGIFVTGAAGEGFVYETRVADNVAQGIFVEAGKISVNRTVMENNGSSGILVNPAAAGTVNAVVRSSLAVGNSGTGIVAITDAAGEAINFTADDCGAIRNGFSGFAAKTNSLGAITLVVNQSVSTDNATNGVFANGSNATISVSASAVSRNGAPGLSQNVASVIRSHGNNAVNGNAISDTFGLITPV